MAVILTPKPGGPILVQGEVEIRQPDGTPIPIPVAKTPGIIKLCACGRSATRPFCDGRHKLPPPSGGS